MITAIILLLASAVPLMGSPGPATLSCAAAGAAWGFRRALPYAIGIMAGTACVLVLVASGVTGALLAAPGAVPVLALAGSLYMLWLAWRIATAPPLDLDADRRAAPGFASGWVLAIANPKAFAAIGAVNATHTLLPGDPVADAVVKVTVLSVVIVVANGLWLALGSALSRVLADPVRSRWANRTFALALVISVSAALLDLATA